MIFYLQKQNNRLWKIITPFTLSIKSSVVGVEDICIVKVNELSLNRTTFNCVEKFDSKVLLMIFVFLFSQS